MLVAVSLAQVAAAYMLISRDLVAGWLLYVQQVSLIVSIVYLIGVGAGWLVGSACRMARLLGISDLVIGLTVVAFGTSAPEAAASLAAGFKGNGDITIANVIGSNIFNLCFILGGVALLVKGGLRTDRALFVRDGPILLFGTLLLFLFVGGIPGSVAALSGPSAPSQGIGLLNLRLERWEGVVLVAGLVAYLMALYVTLRTERRASRVALTAGHARAPRSAGVAPDPDHDAEQATWLDIPIFLAGLLFVVGGCHLLVGHAEVADGMVKGFGALWFAKIWHVPDYVVGVTIVAAGTSAPEFVVSLVAALRGSFGISAGNLLGSDIFNMFGVVGLAGIIVQPPLAPAVAVSPLAIPSLLALCALVAITIFFMWTGNRVSRLEGAILLLIGIGRWIFDFTSQG